MKVKTMQKSHQFNEYLKHTFVKYSIILIVAIFALFFILMLLMYRFTVVHDNEVANAEVSTTLEQNLNSVQSDLLNLAQNAAIQNRLFHEDNQLEVNQILYAYVNRTSYDDYFLLINQNGEISSTNLYLPNKQRVEENLQFQNILKNADSKNTSIYQQINPITFESNQQSEYVVAKAIQINGTTYGYLLLFIKSMTQLADYNFTEDVVLTDRFDNVIYSSFSNKYQIKDKFKIQKTNTSIEDIEGVPFHTVHTTLEHYPIQVATFVSIHTYKRMIIFGFTLFGSVLILLIFVITLLSQRISSKVLEPLNTLLTGFNAFKGQQLAISNDKKTFEEFQIVIDEFNQLTSKIETLIEHNQQMSQKKNELEIKHLKNQFNPHFVFNTLETLRYEIAFDQEKAEKMVLALADLIRYSLHEGQSVVTIEKELEMVNQYLQIQKMRFEHRLSYSITVNEDVLHLELPKLILQTIVENSIKHCMEHTLQLHIGIDIQPVHDTLQIIIHDNGPGIAAEKHAEIVKTLNQEQQPDQHIGLYITQKVIQLMYGKAYGLRIETVENKGTTCIITLPTQQEVHYV